MSKPRAHRTLQAAQRRIQEIRAQIGRIEHVASGTISRRMKRCGKARCRCQTDPAARHGPYVEWTRYEGGKLRTTLIDSRLLPPLRRAIQDKRRLERLQRAWQRESVRAIRASIDVTPDEPTG